MNIPLWEAIVRGERNAWWVRTQFHADYDVAPDPIWSFERFGMSRTILPNGVTVCIGGEHEDAYNPDFYVYNDVIVLAPHEPDEQGHVMILGYPKAVFAPTDFHTATLVNDQIYVIGSLGYLHERKPGFTPVYRLDCTTYRIEALQTDGENPGWLSGHEAEFDASNQVILIAGGHTFEWQNGNQVYRPNESLYSLDLVTLHWQRR